MKNSYIRELYSKRYCKKLFWLKINDNQWCIHVFTSIYLSGFSGSSVVKNLPANAGNTGVAGLIPGLGRSSGGRNGNPLQFSCLENPMDRGAWWPVVCGVAKNWIQLRTYRLNTRAWEWICEDSWLILPKLGLILFCSLWLSENHSKMHSAQKTYLSYLSGHEIEIG